MRQKVAKNAETVAFKMRPIQLKSPREKLVVKFCP